MSRLSDMMSRFQEPLGPMAPQAFQRPESPREWAKEFEVRGGLKLWRMRFDVTYMAGDMDFLLTVDCVLPDASTGGEVHTTTATRIRHDISREEFMVALRESVRYFVLHEADESLWLRGERPWDPHAPERR